MKRVARNLPSADWSPPYPAWEPTFLDDMQAAICYVGCQGEATQSDRFRRMLLAQVSGRNDCHIEFAKFSDGDGNLNTVGIVYWEQQTAFRIWRANDAEALLSLADDGDSCGIWIENFPITRKDFESMVSSDDQLPGIARYGKGNLTTTELHAYFGSMRDRIISSNESDHKSPIDKLEIASGEGDRAKRISIPSPPQLCAIRSGQDWSRCGDEQREYYLTELEPLLREGMEFLAKNPIDTGCVSCRYMTETDDTGREKERTFGFAVFKDIADLVDRFIKILTI